MLQGQITSGYPEPFEETKNTRKSIPFLFQKKEERKIREKQKDEREKQACENTRLEERANGSTLAFLRINTSLPNRVQTFYDCSYVLAFCRYEKRVFLAASEPNEVLWQVFNGKVQVSPFFRKRKVSFPFLLDNAFYRWECFSADIERCCSERLACLDACERVIQFSWEIIIVHKIYPACNVAASGGHGGKERYPFA